MVSTEVFWLVVGTGWCKHKKAVSCVLTTRVPSKPENIWKLLTDSLIDAIYVLGVLTSSLESTKNTQQIGNVAPVWTYQIFLTCILETSVSALHIVQMFNADCASLEVKAINLYHACNLYGMLACVVRVYCFMVMPHLPSLVPRPFPCLRSI